MIVHYSKLKTFNILPYAPCSILLVGFPLLFTYSSVLLKDLYELWPDTKKHIDELKEQRLIEESITIFDSNGSGKLCLVSYALFPKIKDQSGIVRETQAKKENILSFMNICINHIPEIELIHVNMSSLISTIVDEREWLAFFASNKRNFAIYH